MKYIFLAGKKIKFEYLIFIITTQNILNRYDVAENHICGNFIRMYYLSRMIIFYCIILLIVIDKSLLKEYWKLNDF